MELEVKQAGPNVLVAFGGRTDLEGDDAAAFKDRMKALVADGARRVVVDLGNVAFMDSGGLGALLSCLKALKQAEGHLVLANVSTPVESVLRITRLERVFELRANVDDACRALDRRPVTAERGA